MYNTELLADAISNIDDAYLKKYFQLKEKATQAKKTAGRAKIMKWAAGVAACFLVALIAIPAIMHFTQNNIPAPATKYYDSIAEACDDLGDILYSKLELNGASIMASYKSDEDGNALLDSPLQMKIRHSYSTEAGKDTVDYYVLFDKDNVDESYIGGYDEQGLTKIINGVTIHYSEIFDGSNHTQAKFLYEGNLYVIDIVSSDKINLDCYLNRVLCD